MVLSADAARTVVGIIGNVISFGLFISPVPTFYRIIKKKSVEEFKPDPYLATVLNCMLWIFYGMPFVHPDSLLVVTINSVGLVFELIYLGIFFIYAKKDGRKKVAYWLAGEVLFFIAVVLLGLLLFNDTKTRSLFVGIFCDILNILMYFSPLTIMKKVIVNKSVEYMPFYLSLANFLNGSVWTAYALIKFDIYVLVSNGLGAISGAIQLILYAVYCRYTPKHGDGKGSKQSELELSTNTNLQIETV
ncbi:Bidirectional sugar transporter SWEET6b [Morus notabilis]|uniref:Bidirectional sugar transporter SWEET n=1 Tax=Morus notabilis TaxID=981085 RepID=W9SX85_9ROSA|nr:bidirectional sugar transporter SWEET6b [Morus notabilis]EXC31625.1 Bidirectional sugar transporter SWEET6b [Morus notabilis]